MGLRVRNIVVAVKFTPLLAASFTVTTTFPVLAPAAKSIVNYVVYNSNDSEEPAVGSGEGCREERENCPRDHEGFSQVIASLLIVLCSTGTILGRKGNAAEANSSKFEE